MSQSILYAWQEGRDPRLSRAFLRRAIDWAVKASGEELSVEEVARNGDDGLDSFEAGLEDAALVIADVTPIGTVGEGVACPDPNVLLELGFARRALGAERVIAVANSGFGEVDSLPSGLMGDPQPLDYGLKAGMAKEEVVAAFQGLGQALVEAIKAGLAADLPVAAAASAAHHDDDDDDEIDDDDDDDIDDDDSDDDEDEAPAQEAVKEEPAPKPKPKPKPVVKQIDELPPYDGLAAKLLVHILRQSDGTEHIEMSTRELRKVLGDIDKDEFQDLILDLQDDGVIKTGTNSDGVAFVRPNYELYKRYDETVMEFDTVGDAKKCAKLILQSDDYWVIYKLHQRLRWPERRLNPAVQYLFPMFKPGRVSSGTSTNYVAFAVTLEDEERDALEEFLES